MASAKDKAGQAQGFPGDEDYDPGMIATLERQFMELVEDPTQVLDPREVQMSIVKRILGADDFDAALDMADAGALSLEDVGDSSFYIDAISWHKSAEGFREGGLGVFALLGITGVSGPLRDKQEAITAGGVNVLAALYKGIQGNHIPDPDAEKRREFRLRAVNTASGFTTYWLARA